MDAHRWSRGVGGEQCEVCFVRRCLGQHILEWQAGGIYTKKLRYYYSLPHGTMLEAVDCPPCETSPSDPSGAPVVGMPRASTR